MSNIYSFSDLTKLVQLSDLDNPNADEQQKAEQELIQIGFYQEEDGAIVRNEKWADFKTSDGKSLMDLEDWFDENMC